MTSVTNASLLFALTTSLGCGLELSSSSDDSPRSADRGPGGARLPTPEQLTERARIAASGKYLAKKQLGPASLLPADWGTALDIPTSFVTNATLTGAPQAAAILPGLGIIRAIRGGSFVMLSTGVAARPSDPGFVIPEPGTDFPPAGVAGDAATLTLDLQIPAGANRMSLAYNFLSSESPDYIGSDFNDTFSIQVIQGGVTRSFELASVNSSLFFDASDSRAKDSGYNIFTDDPADVDTVFDPPGLFPDAGLTDPQPFSVDIGGGPLRLVFSIQDNGDGILDSAVLLDAVRFSGFETIDPNPDLITAAGELTGNVNTLTAGGRYVAGAVADGVTPVLLRIKVPEPGQVTFSILGANGPSDGTLSTVGGNQAQANVVAQTVTAATGEYALAVYHVPADFNRGGAHQVEDEARTERPVQLKATFVSGDGDTFDTQIDLQIRRPPVVLANGMWSKAVDWNPAITQNPTFAVTFAEYPYSCNNELRVVVPPNDVLECPWTIAAPTQGQQLCSQSRGNQIERATGEALTNVRGLGMGFAVTKVDLIAHGSRGRHARKYINSPGYKNRSNLGQGDVNRLITINTPHFGSKVADAIVAARDLPNQKETFLCEARLQSLAPVEPGDIDELTTANSALTTTDVPSHAIVGSGGSLLTPMLSTRKLTSRSVLYVNSKIALKTLFGAADHDLFIDVTSQRGGLPVQAATVLPMTNAAGARDSDFFNTVRDARVANRIVALLNQPVDGGQFSRFPATPPAQPFAQPFAISPDDPAHVTSAFTSYALPPPAPSPAAGLRILAPATGAIVSAGNPITVTMAVENGFAPETILVFAGNAVATSSPASLTVTVQIPADAWGPINLFALGFAGDDIVVSNNIVLIAKSTATLSSVSIITQDPILPGPGANRQLVVAGYFSGGVVRDITAGSTGTIYTTSQPGVVAVNGDGQLTAVGAGIATVVARNSGKQDSVTVTVTAKANSLPVAAAKGTAALACVAPGGQVPVHLDGTLSHDPDGDPLQWSWLEGTVVLGAGPTLDVGLGVGVHVIKLEVSDGHGGLAQTVVNIDVHADSAPPTVTMIGPNPVTLECGAAYTDPGATAIDDCAGDLTAGILAVSSVNTGVPGSYSVSYQAQDQLGQIGTASRAVNVQDTTAPALACPSPVVAECTGSSQAVVDPGDATAVDSCSAAIVDDLGPSSYPLGTTPITVKAHDGSGNQATCSTSVTVQDTVPPAITCPPMAVAECTGNGQAVVDPGAAVASDVCTTVSVSKPGAGSYPLGTTPVVFTAKDKSFNEASCTSAVKVVDTTPPQLSLTPPAPLWPLDHLYRTISLADCQPVVQDACGGVLAPGTYQGRITCVTSDEPDDAVGNHDGNTIDDIVIVNDTTVKLRSERHSSFDGRVYKIHFQVRDGAGNLTSGVCPVSVPYYECKPDDEECSVVDSGVVSSVCH